MSVTAEYHTEEKMSFEVEDLVGWNPDVIVVSSDADKEEALTNDKYAGITAVKNGEVYVIPTGAHLWGARTPENLMSIFWCMNKLYPEVMPTDEFSKKIKTFYKECYQVDLTDGQVAEFTA